MRYDLPRKADEMKPTKEDVSRQFGRNAQSYARSKGHAGGSDLDIVLLLLAPHAQMRVLDVATGAGHTACKVAPFVESVLATDLTPEMIEETRKLAAVRKLTNVETALMDVEDLPLPGAAFDAVTCRIAAHHFLDIEKALSEISRVLKAGGIFLLEDSFAPAAARQDRFINDLEKLRDSTHVRSYTKAEWKALLAAAGFKVTRLRNYRKRHEVAEWIEHAGLSPEHQEQVYAAFAAAPLWARRQFEIEYEDERAVRYADDKLILRAIKT